MHFYVSLDDFFVSFSFDVFFFSFLSTMIRAWLRRALKFHIFNVEFIIIPVLLSLVLGLDLEAS